MVQLGEIVLASNLPMPFALLALLTIGIVIEEIAKSCNIAVLVKHKLVASWKNAVSLALISTVAFFLGEKVLLFFSMSIISESIFTTALFTTNLIWLPLLAHAVSTLIVIFITYRLGVKHYSTALILGSAIHLFYNLLVMGILQ